MSKYYLVDARDKILGRLCTGVAKALLNGRRVLVVNSKDCVVSGKKGPVFKKYLDRQEIHTATNPRRGPFWPHRPDGLLKRTVRGMLPKNERGARALKRLRVFVSSIPEGMAHRFQPVEEMEVPDCDVSRLQFGYVTLDAICTRIGWKHKVQEEGEA
ncbi:MAG: 50S ribosomal protein L13 [Promethearchaeota archaeon]